MANLAPANGDVAARVRALPLGSTPSTRRHSAEAVGLLLGVLLVMFSLALAIGGPAVIGP